MARALVVGNGPSALEKSAGSIVDSDKFDAVFRLNRWAYDIDGTPFKQYPEQVGTRCDYWIVNDLHLTETRIALKYGEEYEGVLVVAPKFKWHHISQQVEVLKQSHPYLNMVPFEYEDAVNNVVSFAPKWPSTGIIAIAFAVEHFDEVYLHGFDCYDTKYDNLHYFESATAKHGRNKFRDGNTNDHSASNDKIYIQHLLETANVKYL